MMAKRGLQRLRSGEPVFGALQMMPGPTVTELAVWAGFDFVLIDCEHGVVDEPAQVASLQMLSGSDAFAVVRVRPGDLASVGRYLDFGADGIMMPDVRSAAAAVAFVAAATHGPTGTRSSTGSGSRAARYGLAAPPPGDPPLLLAMIESAAAVASIASIVETPGIGGIVIGPYDLAADLGCAGDFSAPAYQAAFETVESAAVRHGLALGSVPHPGFPAERLIAAGHRLILASVDVFALRDGLRSHLAAARGGAP